jgi:hypothetical protein
VGLPIQGDYDARGPVYQRRVEHCRRICAEARLSRDSGCTAHEPGRTRTARAEVDSQYDVRVEYGNQFVEVAAAGCQKEGVDHRSLTGGVKGPGFPRL